MIRSKQFILGGGSPSLLPKEYLQQFINATLEIALGHCEKEITLEANPDDMSLEKLRDWKNVGINRLSVGIQSFRDEDLRWMNRAHNAAEAISCIQKAKDLGFQNISIDLIYGIPSQSAKTWKENLDRAIEADIQHISAYCLTIEKNTVFGKWKAQNKILEAPEGKTAEEFFVLKEYLSKAGFEQYEISNFAKPNSISQHNTNYWRRRAYLGIGPSAHSFRGDQRLWNIRNNQVYIRSLGLGILPIETEELNEQNIYNEMILTGLRTKWGIDLNSIKRKFNIDILEKFPKEIERYSQDLVKVNEHLRLNDRGLLKADRIASDLFWV